MNRKALLIAWTLVANFPPLTYAQLREYAVATGNLDYTVHTLELDPGAPNYCYPLGINDRGTIVGYCNYHGLTPPHIRGFRVDNGVFSSVPPDTTVYPPFGTLHGSWDPSQIDVIAQDINDNNSLLIQQMFTIYSSPSGRWAIVRSGEFGNTHVNIAGSPQYVYAVGLDSTGRVIGRAVGTQSFLWTAGNTRFFDLPSLPEGAASAGVSDLNIHEDVLGSYSQWNPLSGSTSFFGWARINNQTFRVSNPAHADLSRQLVYVEKINDFGDVVGYYNEIRLGRYRGFLISNGVFYPVDSGYENTVLTGIANNGTLTGYALNSSPDLPTVVGLKIDVRLDRDGDGLLDEWERNGMGSGAEFLNLPAMGADPFHKDIFVEVDYMEDGTHSHAFSADAQEIVIQMFRNAPVQNPDRTTGINIHIDAGKTSIMNPVTGELWGEISRSDALPHVDTLGRVNVSKKSYDWREFQKIKADNFDGARSPAFHYVVFAHDLGGAIGISGVGETPGNDFIVSLGTGWERTRGQQAGTFAHELGHNLGLYHGGDAGAPNGKPNYLSVMNYLFQNRGLSVSGTRAFNYSRYSPSDIADLSEEALDESLGIVARADLFSFGSLYRCVPGPAIVIPSLNSPVDWNCENGLENIVATDVNLDDDQTTLSSFDDWNYIRFSYPGSEIGLGTDTKNSRIVVAESTVAVDELTADEDRTIPYGNYAVAIDRPDFQAALPGTTVTYRYRIINLGQLGDTFHIAARSSLGWADLSSIPTYITIESGQRVDLSIPVTIPETAVVGAVDLLDITVTSRTDAQSSDSFQSKTTALGELATLTCAGRNPTIVGTNGDDVINGTPGPDVIAGLNGNDIINGAGGDDIICGGNGSDVLDGGTGDDVLEGGNGDDMISGGPGNDRLFGDRGDDVLRGDAGQDRCIDTEGKKVLATCEVTTE